MSARATVRKAWERMPDDAVRVALVAAMMPIMFWIYQLGWNQFTGRLLFSLGVGVLGVLVGWLVQERRDMLGYLVGSCAIVSTIYAIVSLFALDDPTMTWRTVMLGSQATVVGGWFMLWRFRRKWVSRTIAFWAFVVSAIGFALYILSNFGLPDPALADPRTWGWTEPKGIIRRTMQLPLEPVLGIVLWSAIAVTLRRFLRGHGGRARHP